MLYLHSFFLWRLSWLQNECCMLFRTYVKVRTVIIISFHKLLFETLFIMNIVHSAEMQVFATTLSDYLSNPGKTGTKVSVSPGNFYYKWINVCLIRTSGIVVNVSLKTTNFRYWFTWKSKCFWLNHMIKLNFDRSNERTLISQWKKANQNCFKLLLWNDFV